MTLGDMADALRDQAVDAPSAGLKVNASISAITYDSRRVVPGSVFVALKGLRADGGAFAEQAAQRGALAIVSESARPDSILVPWLTVRDARLALALLADRFFNHPSRRMPVIGVTGTSGKTTTAYLLASILDAAGLRAGMLGTVAYRIGGEDREASRTTPEAPDVQQLLSEMLEQGCRSAVMEVSSHALSLKRVDGMHFAAGVFSNLTRDHLDFHEDMEAYFVAKRRLFEMLPATAPGVINMDDPRGPALVEICRRPVTYAINATADVTPGPIEMTLSGLRFDVKTPKGSVRITSKLVGRPNVYNILAAAATAISRLPIGRSNPASGLSGAGPFRCVGRRRRPHHRRRLRAHRRCAAEPARDGAAVVGEAVDHRVRLRRRSRSIEAAADGHGRGPLERRRRDHLRQPALGRPGADHRGNRARHSRRQPGVVAAPIVESVVDRAAAIERAVTIASPATSC